MGRGLPAGRGTGSRAQRAGALRGEGTEPRGAGEDSTLATPHHAGAWWSQPPAPGPYSPGHPCRLSGGPSWCPGSHGTASNLMAGAHIRGFLRRGDMALGRHSPWSQAGEGTGRRSHLGQGGGGGVGRGWGVTESPQAGWPSGQGSPLRPQAPPGCLLSALSSKEKQQEGAVDPESGGQSRSPCPCPQGPAQVGRERGWSECLTAARPPRPTQHSSLPGVIFLPHGHSPDTPELVLRNRLFFPRW